MTCLKGETQHMGKRVFVSKELLEQCMEFLIQVKPTHGNSEHISPLYLMMDAMEDLMARNRSKVFNALNSISDILKDYYIDSTHQNVSLQFYSFVQNEIKKAIICSEVNDSIRFLERMNDE